jgi:hypothetical protein
MTAWASGRPQNVDCVGLDAATRSRLLFYYGASAGGGGALRNLTAPLHIVRALGPLQLHTDLVDAHMYVFDRCGCGRGWTGAGDGGDGDCVP